MMTSDVVGSQTPAQGPTLKHDVWFCFQNLQLPRNAGLLEHRLSQGANLRHSRPLYLARVVDLDGADPHPQASGSSGRKLGIRALHTTRGSQEVNFPSSVANGAHHPDHVSDSLSFFSSRKILSNGRREWAVCALGGGRTGLHSQYQVLASRGWGEPEEFEAACLVRRRNRRPGELYHHPHATEIFFVCTACTCTKLMTFSADLD